MHLVFNVALLLGLFALAVVYLRFALLDHRFPDKPPTGWQVGKGSLLLVLVELISVVSLESDPARSANFASIAVGLLVAPAIAPPIYTDKTLEPNFMRRLAIGIHSWASGIVVRKLVALVVFAICALLFPQAWFFVVALIAGILLYAKAAALAQSEAGAPDAVLTPSLLKRWTVKWLIAALCFSVLWSFCPYAVLTSVQSTPPSSWSSFAGLGLGALLSMLSGAR